MVAVVSISLASSSFLSVAGDVGSLISAIGIVAFAIVWLWRRSRLRAFPDLGIEVTGSESITVEHVITAPGAGNGSTEQVTLRCVRVNIMNQEPDRNAALTIGLRLTGPDGDEVLWTQPRWRITGDDIDESADILWSPLNIERGHAISGVILFAASPSPIDESIPSKLDVYDHVSRKRVRIPGNTNGTYGKNSWEVVGATWYQRHSERERSYWVRGRGDPMYFNKPAGWMRENRQVGTEPEPIKPANSERQE